MRTRILATALAMAVSGCAGGMFSAQVTATTPELVYIEPGIQVVVDSDVPVFYTDNYYWRYEGNVWYRSHVASGGWIRFDAAPQHLRRIERPQQYAHYRPRGPVAHDQRATQPPPVVRDHRTPPPQQQHRDDRKDKDKGNKNRGRDKDEHSRKDH